MANKEMMSLQEALRLIGEPKFDGNFEAYASDLKTNFRKKIVKFHSDKNKEEKLGREIIEAYSVIKNAIMDNKLNTYLKKNMSSSDGERFDKVSEKYGHKWWEDDLHKDVSNVVDDLVSKLGSMKSLLNSLTPGKHSLNHNGFSFEVTCEEDTSSIMNSNIWLIHSTSVKRQGFLDENKEEQLSLGMNPVQLILKG